MSNVTSTEILRIVEERCLFPGSFEEFASKLLELKVIRQTYDVVSDKLYFYSANELVHEIDANEIKGYSHSVPFAIAPNFNLNLLEKSLEDFESGKLSVLEFHQQLASAGIVYVSVHIPNQKVYYLSQDGQHYLESF